MSTLSAAATSFKSWTTVQSLVTCSVHARQQSAPAWSQNLWTTSHSHVGRAPATWPALGKTQHLPNCPSPRTRCILHMSRSAHTQHA